MVKTNVEIATRFAPSPTGKLHIGSVRTALFSWLYARKHDGKFLLRIEDTDRLRSTDEATQLIFESLDWLGLDIDQPATFQSERTAIYQAVATELVDAGKAYYCDCSGERLQQLRKEQEERREKPRYDRKCRERGLKPSRDIPLAIRFRNPLDGVVTVDDMVQGQVEYSNSELDDLVILRSDGYPTYNFAVVVDEIDMGVTHVIRGDDHLNNTPRQINLYKAMNATLPRFGHVPMILSADGRKISKRKDAPSVLDFRDAGYLPEAVLNYLVRLGWSHGDQEKFSLAEMIEFFDAENINRSPAKLDEKKLEWVNHQYMMNGDADRICELARPFFQSRGIHTESTEPELGRLFAVQKERSRTLVQFVESSEYFYKELTEYNEVAAKKFLTRESREYLADLQNALKILENWTKSGIHGLLQEVVERRAIKFGAIAQPLRVALTGGTVSPGIDAVVELLGREQVLNRIDKAIQWIDNQPNAEQTE